MTDQDKITAILNAIQDNNQLMLLLKTMIANNIVNVPSANLTAMCYILGIPVT